MKTDPVRAEQDEEILRLRCAGLSLRAIAARVGLSHQGVSDRITAAIEELVSPVAEEWRALETARLDDLTQRAYQVLDGAESGETALRAIAQLERLSASRRKLWALDMPVPLDVTLSRRLDVEGDVVVDAISAVIDVLGLDEERRQLAVRAAMAKLSGEPLPEVSAPVVEESKPDLMDDYRKFCEAEGIDPDEDDQEDDDDE
ncbi:helix-turn-helix domain-containing protein [Streptomyces sp. ME08-AFT2]|uniref:helix-turn-helix domain-containing protein n=1 Tax=Streptomyces sp. ME08-AFT2 TaxID=3028683 RepID=UPI0029BF85C8|nr:helix-turn-helix domain-containing protein [Streptomyces sp. ME08-AFT2]MDX3314558.1 helix-turn-helix domain-containing protein [Streptomyces sp. ME08-AFT2]